MKIGAHVSIAGSYLNALDSIAAKGGNCMQIFSSSPRDWKNPQVSDETIIAFRERNKAVGIDPIFFHAVYLINLSNNGAIGASSVDSLIHELYLASMVGIQGSVIHLGSLASGQYDTLIANIQKVIDQTPANTQFIIENAGSRKIGTTMEEIGTIVKDVGSDRVKVCLDTCHLHAAGYDLTSKDTLDTFLLQFDSRIGIERLAVIHANDSKDSFASFRDRHENIGEGNVGISVFENLLNHPETRNIPFIIETPGFDQKGPDKQNIDILKSLVHE